MHNDFSFNNYIIIISIILTSSSSCKIHTYFLILIRNNIKIMCIIIGRWLIRNTNIILFNNKFRLK